MAKTRRMRAVEPAGFGFWDRPVLVNLAADILFVLAIAGLTWAASAALQRLPFFPLRQVLVEGDVEQVTSAQLEQATRVALTGNFFTIDLDGARSAYEKLPWVRKAEVRRRWPDALELRIEEHRAVARWQQADGESRLVNGFGEVFAAASEADLPVLAGPARLGAAGAGPLPGIRADAGGTRPQAAARAVVEPGGLASVARRRPGDRARPRRGKTRDR
ncbi:MAG: FtsQ-type POTRA domain-containing protein [Rhodocyclaceae bacterium]|nr:FtsQ-type POTRA domain-containing protein [Rhodocyclaceae bacterium]